jgi:hypothetical protein
LYDIIGDDDLYDLLAQIAVDDPTADARPEVVAWLGTHGISFPGMENILQDTGVYDDVEDQDVNATNESLTDMLNFKQLAGL